MAKLMKFGQRIVVATPGLVIRLGSRGAGINLNFVLFYFAMLILLILLLGTPGFHR